MPAFTVTMRYDTIDTSNRLATIHQRYRQTDRQRGQDRQRSDSIGRTVLQTVAPKLSTLIMAALWNRAGHYICALWL